MGSIDEQDERKEGHRRFRPVYFMSLSVAGARCFGPQQTLSLSHDGRPAKWTVILGENGVGKTTVLQCLWAVAPQVSPAAPGARPASRPRGYPFAVPSLRRSPDASLSLQATVVLQELLTSPRVGTFAGSAIESEPDPLESVEEASAWIDTISRHSAGNALCCGYGALRRAAKAAVEGGEYGHSAASLFSDDAELISGSEWLLRADYAANTIADARAAARRDKIQAALIDLLPDVHNLRVAGLHDQPPQPRLDVQTPYGWVPMRALSLGYRSMIAWVVDLASRMFEAYPDSADPLSEPAIALVDEIDLHLHPRWQREITAHLDRLFPNVQFIVTAHSPLVVQAPGVTNVAVLRRVDDHVEIVNDPEEVRGWRVDQILTSDLFGLSSARPVEVEKLMERQQELVLLDAPTEAQRAELAAVDARLAELVPGETAQERETWAVVRRLANRLASDSGHG